jgi:hypothetical protein
LKFTPSKQNLFSGFTVLEAVMASGLLALGLAGSVRLSAVNLAATQASQRLDLASGLAQDLAECWGVQTATCIQAFSSSADLSPLSTDPGFHLQRTWQVTHLLANGPSMASLEELRIQVSWLDGLNSSELVWIKRRASTPTWVGS